MFLFESFIYNEEEAKKLYGSSFRSAWSWIKDVIMDKKYISQFNAPEERRHFMFSVNIIRMPSNMFVFPFEVLEINEYGLAENERIPLDKEQKDYIKNKLSILGDAVHIIDDNYNDGKAIAITYDISKDEYRWNLVHKQIKDREDKLNNAVNQIEISEPSLDAWSFMLKSFYDGKNPKLIFKKYSGNLDQLMQYLVVAHKINWDAAVKQINGILYTCFGDGRLIPDNTEQANPYKEAVKRAAERYEPDEDIQELINDYKDYSKNISKQAIPSKIMHICKTLDNNPKVKKYENLNGYHYAINVLLSNEQAGRIYIDNYTSRGIKPEEEFYTISVATNTQNCEKRTLPVKLKLISKEIDSAVNAIYYDDPSELKK